MRGEGEELLIIDEHSPMTWPSAWPTRRWRRPRRRRSGVSSNTTRPCQFFARCAQRVSHSVKGVPKVDDSVQRIALFQFVRCVERLIVSK